MFRILVLLSLPMICLGQGSLGRERLPVEKLNNEISPNELKRNALYNMDEIKVRWKKAALENCPGGTLCNIGGSKLSNKRGSYGG